MSNAIEQATFSFDKAALDPFADRMQQTFESAKPFSYAMVDGPFPLYYYTNGRSDEEVQEAHSTLFQSRPGEKVRVTKRDALPRWVPPPILDWLHARKR